MFNLEGAVDQSIKYKDKSKEYKNNIVDASSASTLIITFSVPTRWHSNLLLITSISICLGRDPHHVYEF